MAVNLESARVAALRAPHDVMKLMRDEIELDWRAWLAYLFPEQTTSGFAPHHVDFWEWGWSIRLDQPARDRVEIWARGGAKSMSVELLVAALAARRRRHYALYVCGTQEQADDHVANIAGTLESERYGELYPECGEPAVGKFGNPKGWRRQRLSTASGFTIDAVGLDTAMRGVRIDADRPDLIIGDDIDDGTDSPKVTQRKVDRLTRSLLPTGAEHAIALFVQNLVLDSGVFARIAGIVPEAQENRPLAGAHVSGPIPAIHDLELTQAPDPESGDLQWKIIGGRPTWEGQGLERAQRQLLQWTKTAFLIEAQHEVQLRSGGIFRAWEWMEERHVPRAWEAGLPTRRFRMWDTAGTEFTGDNDPDWTVGVLLAYDPRSKRYCVEHVARWRHGSGTTKTLARQIALGDVEKHGYEGVLFGIEEEPGWHGRDWATEWVTEVFAGLTSHKIPAATTKTQRAEGASAAMENQLIDVVDADWTAAFLTELEAFPLAPHDDQVDGLSHAFNYMRRMGAVETGTNVETARGMPPRRVNKYR